MNRSLSLVFMALQTFRGVLSGRKQDRHLLGSVMGMGLALIPLLVVLVVTDGMISGISARYQETSSYHLQILPFGEKSLPDIRTQAIAIARLPQVRSVSLERQGYGLAYSRESRTGVTLRGLENSTLTKDPGFLKYLTFSEGGPGFTTAQGALLGQEVARQLGLHLNDELKILTTRSVPGRPFLPRISVFRVEGIFSSGYQELDKLWVLIPFAKAEEILKGSDYVTFLGVKLKDLWRDLYPVQSALRNLLPLDYQNILTWERINNALYKNFEATRTILLFIMILILAVASVSISSAMLMMVLERQKDIAILKACGASPGDIQRVFLVLGIFSGAAGTLVGMGLGLLAAVNINHLIGALDGAINGFVQLSSLLAGREAGQPFHLLNSGYYLETIPVHLDGGTICSIGAFSVLLSVVAAWFPARRAARLKPLDVMRKV